MAENTVSATLRYLKRRELYEREKPFQMFFDIPEHEPDQRPDNLEFEEKEHVIHDMRPSMVDFSLDQHGFQIAYLATSMQVEAFSDRQIVEAVYLPEIEELLRKEDPSIDRTYFFDWRLRSGEMATQIKEGRIDLNNLTAWLHPARAIHVDQSPAAVLQRIQLHLSKDADFLLQGRVRIINAWRPLADAVEDWPLAVCDSTTIADEDLIECDQVRRKFTGATLYAFSDQEQRRYYLHNQRPEEVLLLKMFDSSNTVSAIRCPHGSFKHPMCPPNAPHRRSIEVRALVFNYPNE